MDLLSSLSLYPQEFFVAMIGKLTGKLLPEPWCNNDDIFTLGKAWCKLFTCFVLNSSYPATVIMLSIYKNDSTLLCFFMRIPT